MDKEIEEIEKELAQLIKIFYKDKNAYDMYKKLTEEENKQIKDIMSERGWSEYSTEDLIAKKTIQNRESFNEPALIEKLLETEAKDVIELVPTINWDKIEDMIYNGKLDASILTPYKEVKQVTTLKVTKKKGE